MGKSVEVCETCFIVDKNESFITSPLFDKSLAVGASCCELLNSKETEYQKPSEKAHGSDAVTQYKDGAGELQGGGSHANETTKVLCGWEKVAARISVFEGGEGAGVGCPAQEVGEKKCRR